MGNLVPRRVGDIFSHEARLVGKDRCHIAVMVRGPKAVFIIPSQLVVDGYACLMRIVLSQ